MFGGEAFPFEGGLGDVVVERLAAFLECGEIDLRRGFHELFVDLRLLVFGVLDDLLALRQAAFDAAFFGEQGVAFRGLLAAAVLARGLRLGLRLRARGGPGIRGGRSGRRSLVLLIIRGGRVRSFLLGELFLVVIESAEEAFDAVVAHFEDACGGAADEFEVVADEADRALVVHDGVLQRLARGDVEVRGRFVEDEQVRRVHEDAREAEADLLAAGQHLALLHGVVAGEPERAEDLADARGRGVAGCGVLHDVVGGLFGGEEFGEFLRLVADDDVVSEACAA